MIEIKIQHPYINEEYKELSNLVKYFAEDELGNKYYIKQVETNRLFESAVDIYPSRYTYKSTNNKIKGE